MTKEHEVDPIEIKISAPIDFANKNEGCEDKAFSFFIKPPSYNTLTSFLSIERIVARAMTEASAASTGQERQDQGDVEITGSDVVKFVTAFGDMAAALKAFEPLVLKDGYIVEGTPMLSRHWQGLAIADMKHAFGEYCAFFIIPPLLSET